MNYFTLLSV